MPGSLPASPARGVRAQAEPRLSVIVPTLDEADAIVATLQALQPLRARGHEVVVVDGGSADDTLARARPHADRVLCSERGRALQMNAGARAARAKVLLFLHADTRLPADADHLILGGLDASARAWGRFDVRLDSDHPVLRLVGSAMNLRSRVTRICTGDQAVFVTRAAFAAAGGFPEQPLMEDIALSARLRRMSAPLALRACCRTSARRWLDGGIARTILLMWWLRLRYALGASPWDLARVYGRGPR